MQTDFRDENLSCLLQNTFSRVRNDGLEGKDHLGNCRRKELIPIEISGQESFPGEVAFELTKHKVCLGE